MHVRQFYMLRTQSSRHKDKPVFENFSVCKETNNKVKNTMLEQSPKVGNKTSYLKRLSQAEETANAKVLRQGHAWNA